MFNNQPNNRYRSLPGCSPSIAEINFRLKLLSLELNLLTHLPQLSQELGRIKSSQIKLTSSLHNKIPLFRRNNCIYQTCKWASLIQQANRYSLKRETGVGALLAATQTKLLLRWAQIFLWLSNQCQTAQRLPKFREVPLYCLKLDKSLFGRASWVPMTRLYPPKLKERS
jgi:hypothetical protein